MPRRPNQKLKLLRVLDYLARNTDEQHPATIQQIISYLSEEGIAAERKSIYDDVAALNELGFEILHDRRGYWLESRVFELAELKLLVDSVQSSKFITHKKTLSLIRKLERFTSVHSARQLRRQVHVQNRVKSMNESIYYHVDKLHGAIAQNRQIQFHYFEFNVKKEKVVRRDGAWYVVSPFALAQDAENYYLVAYDSRAGGIRHYRVDKMMDLTVTNRPREGHEVVEQLDMSRYTRTVFGMFSGEITQVRLRFDERLVGAVLDRLGREVILVPDGQGQFTVTADVVVSPQFFAWLCGFGDLAQVAGPQWVVEEMREHVAKILEQYV